MALTDWKDAAYDEAVKRGVDPVIVLATIEAETNGRNILGDSGRAFGYGQVWIKWDNHYNALAKVAKELGIKIPSLPKSAAEEEAFKPIILNNDKLSLGMAVEVIKQKWVGAGKDFRTFTKYYVGSGVEEKDIQRRKAIYDRYLGTDLSAYNDNGTGTGTETKTVSVDVPKGAGQIAIAIAVIMAGVAMLKTLVK